MEQKTFQEALSILQCLAESLMPEETQLRIQLSKNEDSFPSLHSKSPELQV